MIRNKAPRYRNLQNLHVIPTAPTAPIVPFVQPVSNVLITVQPKTPLPITPVTSSQNTFNRNLGVSMYSQNTSRNRRPRRRNRKRKGADRFSSMQTLVPNKNVWYNSNDLNQASFPPSADILHENMDNTDNKTNVIEETDNYMEAHVEEDFEEVEVASVDAADDGEASAGEASVDADRKQEILVGFRTSKVHYLSYKKCFFKPKVYNFSSQRTFVNCLNIQDNCSVDVDVVSEADYEIEFEGEILDQCESQDYLDKIEIKEKVNDTADVFMKSDKDIKVDTKINVDVKSVKDGPILKNKDLKEIENLDHKRKEKDNYKNAEKNPKSDVKIMKSSVPMDIKSVKSKSSTDEKTKINDSKGELNTLNKVSKLEIKSPRTELTGLSNRNKSEKLEIKKVLESSVKKASTQRIYNTSVKNNKDIHQGKCTIQHILDSWESHLIGLEYLIEIQNNNVNSSAMYNCILCSEELDKKEFSSTNVISHINGRKHMVKFLEKHFPSCGIKFCDSNDCNFLLLQKICEEINAKLGYYYMCITNFNFYQNHKKEIKCIVQNASHSREESLKLNKNVFENEVETKLLEEVKDILSSLIKNIVSTEEIFEKKSSEKVSKGLETVLNTYKPVADSVTVTSKASFLENKKKMSNTFQKCKGNSSLTSFLKLKYAKVQFKGSKSVKGPAIKAVKEKIVGAVKENTSEIVTAVKLSSKGFGSVKEMKTAIVTAEGENSGFHGDKKEKNAVIVGAKKENTLKIVAAEDETDINEDPDLESTKPIYQTGIVDDGENSDSSIKIIEIKEVQKPTVHSKHCRKIFVSVNQVELILIQAIL